MKYIHRTLETSFLQAAKQFPVLLVSGARQVGKTTMLKHLMEPSRTYVTLDDLQIRALAKNDPALFLQRFPPPLLIDEVQYAPELFPVIKMNVDSRHEMGAYWLTGSQHFNLMQEVTESLAGRIGILPLMGLSSAELREKPDQAPFLPGSLEPETENQSAPALIAVYKQIFTGSYPAMYQQQGMDRDLFYSSYLQTYIQRDIRSLTKAGSEQSFVRFMRACAARTAQLLNMNDLCRDADISHATGKQWLSVLISSGIIYLLEPFSTNVTSRMVKAPKLFFTDTGLAAYLAGWSSPEVLEAGAAAGAMLETWAVMEILKGYRNHAKTGQLFFYRDRDKKEIDLLIMKDNVLYPIEIKKTAHPAEDSFRHFSVLEKFQTGGMKVGHGAVICFVKQSIPLTKTVYAVPVGSI